MMKKLLAAAVVFAMTAGTAHAEKIGVAMSLFDDNFLTVLRHNLQRHADKLGVEVQMEDALGDIARQQSQIGNLIASGVDGIIVMLVDADSGRAMSRMAEKAGMPLVFDTRARQFSARKPCRPAICSSNSAAVSPFSASSFHTIRCARLGECGSSHGASA